MSDDEIVRGIRTTVQELQKDDGSKQAVIVLVSMAPEPGDRNHILEPEQALQLAAQLQIGAGMVAELRERAKYTLTEERPEQAPPGSGGLAN
jgi:hypothetical protein